MTGLARRLTQAAARATAPKSSLDIFAGIAPLCDDICQQIETVKACEPMVRAARSVRDLPTLTAAAAEFSTTVETLARMTASLNSVLRWHADYLKLNPEKTND